MTLADLAARHHQGRRVLVSAAVAAAGAVWGQLDPADVNGSYAGIADQLLVVTAGGQLAAAREAGSYVTAALAEQDITAAAGRVRAAGFAGVASDGRPLATLLDQARIAVKAALAAGAQPAGALAAGAFTLGRVVATQTADAGRVADGVAITAQPALTGYVRMLNPPSCARCVILAGRHYRWNRGFDRHPLCDCTHIPAGEDAAEDVRTDPGSYFASLSDAEQDKAFTQAGARAIRDGADIAQVVNARRGFVELERHGRFSAR